MKLFLEKLINIPTASNLISNISISIPRNFYGLVLFILFTISCNAKESIITIKVNTSNIENVETVAVRGNIKPLSLVNDYYMNDIDGDGIYETTITFNTKKRNVKFRFIINGELELQGSDPRVVWFKKEPSTHEYVFNEFNYYDKAQIEKLRYTDAQIEEDVAILKEIVQYIHPNIYKFRDSLELQKDFNRLEQDIKDNPTISNTYGAISKFAALIKCSHTFTNPWNQGVTVEKALFYQHNRIPFTFNRIGKRIFIDKNASDNPKLKKGIEVTKINGVNTSEILTRLSNYIASDGNNYEKKLERLVITGEEKFPLFDIFYPIEFGTYMEINLELKDLETEKSFTEKVTAVSKTKRTKTIIDRYGKINTSVKDGWNYEILNDHTAKLTIKSFAVQSKGFDWEAYLKSIFEELNKSTVSNLIIDIRGNEGGQGEVGQYILERILRKPLKVKAMESSVRYVEIPAKFEKHISTWAKFPYDFSGKIAFQENGRYFLKEKYGIPETVFKPQKIGFKGQVYLLTDASNSSATHLMAMYAKQIENITIVGQETGGNQLGTNGDYIFFLRLPNTKIEIDIPVVGQFIPLNETPQDGGVIPHVIVNKNVDDFRTGVDTEMEVVLDLIESN